MDFSQQIADYKENASEISSPIQQNLFGLSPPPVILTKNECCHQYTYTLFTTLSRKLVMRYIS